MTPDQDAIGDAAAFRDRLKAFAGVFDAKLSETVASAGPGAPEELVDAVRYAVLAPGKRLRPYLAVRCCELSGGRRAEAWAVAVAIECVHAFSLVHDDLPGMDDDDLRRGRPTCHKRYGEAIAILAGDALIMLAFEVLARQEGAGAVGARMVAELAKAAGWSGLIGGQGTDVVAQGGEPDREVVEAIHLGKTARLFEVACRLGAMAARAEDDVVDRLARFGELLGRAFQVSDDLLDVTADAAVLGKAVGKDAAAGKQTMVRCVGIEESRKLARQAVDKAVGLLDPFGAASRDLGDLCRFVIDRNY